MVHSVSRRAFELARGRLGKVVLGETPKVVEQGRGVEEELGGQVVGHWVAPGRGVVDLPGLAARVEAGRPPSAPLLAVRDPRLQRSLDELAGCKSVRS